MYSGPEFEATPRVGSGRLRGGMRRYLFLFERPLFGQEVVKASVVVDRAREVVSGDGQQSPGAKES